MARYTHRFTSSHLGTVAACVVTAFTVLPRAAESQTTPGEQTFQTVCIACHTVGGGPLIGPDLVGVELRRSEDWIIDFVQSSQAMVNAGDPDAVALFEEFNRVPMPDNALSDDEVRDVLDFMRSAAASGTVLSVMANAGPVVPATAEEILLGQELFQGQTRFLHGGPTCTSCHDLTNDAVIGGGVLAAELTTVFTRLGGPGVRAILGSPPFPVMQQAYADKPLTDEEVTALVGFLQQTNEQQSFHQPRDYGIRLFVAGLVGAAVLLGLYTMMWRGRKRGSVNQAIFDRQVRST